MSVISTLITQSGPVQVTDSLLTRVNADGRKQAVEWEQTKIVPVRKWRGAMSYYGLALLEDKSGRITWSALEWLREQSRKASDLQSAAHFAEYLSKELNRILGAIAPRFGIAAGIGIHLSVYERVDDRWIPELFHITNWQDPSYTSLRPNGVWFSRETHWTLTGKPARPEDADRGIRLEVAEALVSLQQRRSSTLQHRSRRIAANVYRNVW